MSSLLFGEDSSPIYNLFSFSTTEETNLAEVLQKFENKFLPKRNLSYERFKFLTRKQVQRKNIKQFVTDLKNKVLVKNSEH